MRLHLAQPLQAGTLKGLESRAPSRELLRTALSDAIGDLQLTQQEIEAHSLDVYLAANPVLQAFFWRRVDYLVSIAHDLAAAGALGGPAIDLGGGSGIVSASLACLFSEITLLDRDVRLARHVLTRSGSVAVNLVQADALAWAGPKKPARCVIAADVLEHFQDLEPIIGCVRRWLAPEGVLLTSLPTENLLYRALRVPFGKVKPHDHFHGAAAVEGALSKAGFRAVRRLYHPCKVNVLPLFRITAWQKAS